MLAWFSGSSVNMVAIVVPSVICGVLLVAAITILLVLHKQRPIRLFGNNDDDDDNTEGYEVGGRQQTTLFQNRTFRQVGGFPAYAPPQVVI